MDFQLIWTERALADLQEIVRYYRDDREAKVVYIARIWHGRQDLDRLVL